MKHIIPIDDVYTMKKMKLEEDPESFKLTYEKSLEFYTSSVLSQQLIMYLKVILKSSLIPAQFRSLPLLRMLEDTCKEFLLNDLEATMWSIFLDHVVWPNSHKPLKTLLLFSAYSAKSYLNQSADLQPLTSYIALKYSGFFQGYQKWHNEHSEQMNISQRSFNKYFNTFLMLSIRDLTDYNYYVDDLLHIAPSSGAIEKESSPDFLSESEDFEAPQLMSLNTIFDDEGLPELNFSRSLSIDVRKDIDSDMLESYMIKSPLNQIA